MINIDEKLPEVPDLTEEPKIEDIPSEKKEKKEKKTNLMYKIEPDMPYFPFTSFIKKEDMIKIK